MGSVLTYYTWSTVLTNTYKYYHKMKMLKFLLPILLVASCSSFSLNGLFHSENKAEELPAEEPAVEETEEELEEEDDMDDLDDEEDDEIEEEDFEVVALEEENEEDDEISELEEDEEDEEISEL